MKILQRPKVTRQIRVIRVTRSFVVHPIKRADSRIPSSVDSWLSSAPSIKEPKVQETQNKVITQPPTTKTTPQNHQFRRVCVAVSAIVMGILLVCSIVGVVLAVKLQPTTIATTDTDLLLINDQIINWPETIYLSENELSLYNHSAIHIVRIDYLTPRTRQCTISSSSSNSIRMNTTFV